MTKAKKKEEVKEVQEVEEVNQVEEIKNFLFKAECLLEAYKEKNMKAARRQVLHAITLIENEEKKAK